MTHSILTPLSLIAVAMLTLSTDVSGQNLREQARERARTEPNGTVYIPPSPAHYGATSIEELTKESIVVVTGRLVRRGSFLTSNDSFVRTDYDIEEVAILRGRLPVRNASVPGLATPLTISRWGGEVVVDGVRIRAVNDSFEPIKEGVPYLLFLTPSRSPDIRGYYIASGGAGIFEIVSQQVKPLLKQGNEVFAWAAETPLSEAIRRIQAAGQAQ